MEAGAAPLDRERAALDLFCEAVELVPGDVERWLGDRTADQPSLRARVLELLAADAAGEAAEPAEPAVPLAPPVQIGPYRLEELIGSGGMGSVYRARRSDGLFEQTVAIKFVRAARRGLDMGPLIDAERRLLARMQHPGIARILDGGRTDNGLHYLVMEFVDGRAIDEHVREAGLDRRARVALLREVNAAVTHAHGHGVIHCDIKPANILVAADGRVRLIDFGVARLADKLDAALPQGYTLAYASPQRRAGAAPTVADDVYALGVVLCELITGEVPSPSGLLIEDAAWGDELAGVARRATAAVEVDRYPTVAAYDDDLRRWLELRPVSALPDDWRYRLRKLIQRRPWHAAAAGAAAAGVAASLVIITLLYARAEASRREAETRFGEVRSLASYMLFDLDRQLEQTPGATPVRRQMVGRSQAYLDALAQHAGDSAELKREVAAGLARLAEVQGVPGKPHVGEPAAARRNLERAESMLIALTTAQPKAWAWRADLGNVRYLLALIYGARDNDHRRQLAVARQAEADTWFAVAEGERAGAAARTLADWQVQLTSTRLVQADAQRYLKDLGAAAALQQSEEARLQALPAAVREHIDMDQQLGRLALLLGDSLYYLDRKPEALAAYRRGAARFETGLQRAPLARKLLEGAMFGHWYVGSVLSELKQPAPALAASQRAMHLAGQLLLLDPDNRETARNASMVRSDHASVLAGAGRVSEAITLIENDIRDREARARTSPDDAEAVRDVAVPYRLLADYYQQGGDADTGCRVRQRGLALWEAVDKRWGLSELDRSGELAVLRAAVQLCAAPAGSSNRPIGSSQTKARRR